jgi:hypothetical protein
MDGEGVVIPNVPRANFQIKEDSIVQPLLDFSQSPEGGYVLSYRPANRVGGQMAHAPQVELINSVNGQPLLIVDRKGKRIKYQIVAPATAER